MSNFIKEWTHKEVELLTRSFRRYSAYIFILKFILPITVLVLAFILFLYPTLSGKSRKIVLVAQEAKNTAPDQNPVMVKPKFVGMDSKGQPFQVNAKRGVQKTPTFITLENVVADITLNNQSWVSCISKTADYDSDKHYIKLKTDVNFFMVQDDGVTYMASTDNADIDMDNGIMKSDDPVRIKSDSATLTAQKIYMEREKQKITFTGKVHVVILKK